MSGMDLKILDVWDDELNMQDLYDRCLNAKNTHFIVDCSKESSLTEFGIGGEAINREIEELTMRVQDHNERYSNRVDIILGNYKPNSEEFVESDITRLELKSKNDNAERNRLLIEDGNLPVRPMTINSVMTIAIRLNFFDNVYHWPTYFLVWNGTKVAYPALSKLLNFPDAQHQQLHNLFIVKNRVAKPHRVLLLNELAKRDLLKVKPHEPNFTMLDPHEEIEHILYEVADEPDQYYKHGQTLPNHEPEELYEKNPVVYENTLIDVVSETSMVSTFRTEKCVWPIVYMKPFMIMGAKNINHNLQKFGFELYDELIDYSFDTLESPRDRIVAIADELQRLSNLDLDLDEQYQILKPKLEKNLKNYLELCFRDPYIPSVIRQLGASKEILDYQTQKDPMRPLIDPQHGTWFTYVERDGGNGAIMDLVRNKNSQYLRQIMGGHK